MTTLITLLISLLGYGSPAEYVDYSEDQLNTMIIEAEEATESDDGGINGGWDTDQVNTIPE